MGLDGRHELILPPAGGRYWAMYSKSSFWGVIG